ncbi:MAG: AbrB/MazE/SpoVT family DNA-binding domain-containing protein [Candidatus Aminicenantes bacterium]|nr:AbrB/MazE/SpoVT family DNA-binding domain-containing protein [Candidatus Aminicenantes bacterium]
MLSRVLKWGNSLAVRIPKTMADEMNVAENTSIELKVKEGALEIKPTAVQWTLSALLAGVTEANTHEEWETGPAQGRELL